MAWVRIDDSFASHPKVVAAGPLAMAMQVAALCYCNRELTDGFVPRAVARTLLDWQIEREDGRLFDVGVTCGMQGDDVSCSWVIDVLVEAGMWEVVDGGYLIHDYLEYQPSRAQVESERASLSEKRAAAGRLGGLTTQSKRQATLKQTASNDLSKPEANAEQKGSPKPVPNPTSTRETETQSRGVKGGETPEFVAFWAKYPRKTAKDEAVKAWHRLRPDERLTAEIMAGLDRLLPGYQSAEPRFVPHPSTFLNGRRWTDEPVAAAKSPNGKPGPRDSVHDGTYTAFGQSRSS